MYVEGTDALFRPTTTLQVGHQAPAQRKQSSRCWVLQHAHSCMRHVDSAELQSVCRVTPQLT